MAITATFVADFASFKSAVDGAETKLKQFQSGAQQVEKALTRVGDAFSGRRILQEATLAVKAVTDIGGVTKLTANEQQRLNAQVTEAIAKYTALGQKAPAELTKIQKETTQQVGIFQQMTTALGPLGVALAGAFSVQTIINAGKEVLRFASNMENLSAQTGIGVEELQALNFAAAGADIPIEVLGNAISAMSKRIGEGDDSAVAAVEALGLNLADLKRGNPHETFLKIAEAAKDLENPISALSDLFGERLARQILRLANEDLPALEKAARDTGAVIDEELIRKADEFGDEWERTKIRIQAYAVDIGAALLRLANASAFSQSSVQAQVQNDYRNTIELQKQLAQQTQALRNPLAGAAQEIKALSVEFGKASEQVITNRVNDLAAAQRDAAAAAKQHASELEKLHEIAVETAADMSSVANKLDAAFDRISDIELGETLADDLRQVEARLDAATDAGKDFRDNVQSMRDEVFGLARQLEDAAAKDAFSFSDTLLKNLEGLRRSVPQLITDAFTGGGNLKGGLKAIAVQLANAFVDAFVGSLIANRFKIGKAFASLFAGNTASRVAGAAGGSGGIAGAVLGFIPGLGGAPKPQPSDKIPVASNEPVPPPPGTVITTPTPGSGAAPGPGNPGGSVTQSVLTGGFRNPLVAAGGGAAAGPTYNSVVINVSAVDTEGFDRVWREQMIPRLQLELMTNQQNTVTNINRVVAKRPAA